MALNIHPNTACFILLPGCPFFSSMSGALGPPGYGGGGSLDILAGCVDRERGWTRNSSHNSPVDLHSGGAIIKKRHTD